MTIAPHYLLSNKTWRPALHGTFITKDEYGVTGWNAATWDQEMSQAHAVGVTTYILQITADHDDQTSWYTSPSPDLTRVVDLATPFIEAGRRNDINTWLGLAAPVYYPFYLGADDPLYMAGLLARQKTVADELYALYSTRIAGWYIPQEVDDALLENANKIAGARAYYIALVKYLHGHHGGRPVFASPFYSGDRLAPGPFATALHGLFDETGIDALAIQDGAGDNGGHSTAQIKSYFEAIRTAFNGNPVQIWSNNNLYDPAYNTLDTPTFLANLAASGPGYQMGFSYTSHMSPIIGTSSYYDDYQDYINS